LFDFSRFLTFNPGKLVVNLLKTTNYYLLRYPAGIKVEKGKKKRSSKLYGHHHHFDDKDNDQHAFNSL